jgi:purine-binding chemotaxis protein CheW
MQEPGAIQDAAERSLVFRLGEERFSLRADRVMEVMRKPAITRVPHGPEALTGIANFRGAAIPVLSAAILLGRAASSDKICEKLIVCERNGPLGLLVDEVLHLDGEGDSGYRSLDIDRALDESFKVRPRDAITRLQVADNDDRSDSTAVDIELRALLAFNVAGQKFGLPIETAHAVFASPSANALPSGVDGAVLGLINFRESALPLISVAILLGLGEQALQSGCRVIVIEHEGERIGLVADSIDAILRLPEAAIDTVPALLKRGAGVAEIEAIGRIDGGRLLISILSAKKLFGNTFVRQVVDHHTGIAPMPKPERETVVQEQFLIFALGDEFYGLPIAAVDEVVSVPDAITRMPNAPEFVKGVMNLRGRPVPLIDQRVRFEVADGEPKGKKPRAVIVTIGLFQAGFIVDSVSEVVSLAASALAPAPDFSSERSEVFDRVAHMSADGRMLLLVNPRELLTRAEQDIVAALRDAISAAVPS